MKLCAECFEKALMDCETVPEHLEKAIILTKKYSELCSKISWWREGLWELIEEFLNTNPQNVNAEYFEQACALLGD